MPDKCCALNCRTGYNNEKAPSASGISLFRFPKDPTLAAEWKKRISRENWKPSESAKICSLHFKEEDIIRYREDSNKRRTKPGSQELLPSPRLRVGAIPTIFVDLPSYKNVPVPEKRASASRVSAESRRRTDELREEDNIDQFFEEDVIGTVDEILAKAQKEVLPDGFLSVKNKNCCCFLYLSENSQDIPQLAASLTIMEDLTFSVSALGKPVRQSNFRHLLKEQGKVGHFSEVANILSTLKNQTEESGKIDWLELGADCLSKFLDHREEISEELRGRVQFLKEQIGLSQQKPKARRYSPEMMIASYLVYAASPQAYRQLMEQNLLILPNERTLRKLTKCIGSSSSADTDNYLQLRIEKLVEHERAVTLVVDEIYVAKRVEYSAPQGQLIGLTEENTQAGTVLCFMVCSLLGKYRDIVALYPVGRLTVKKLRAAFMEVLQRVTELGFQVVASVMDNHVVNRQFYMELCGGQLKTSIQNPFSREQPIFVLFDSVHNFKNIFNNFQKRRDLVFPMILQGGVTQAHFGFTDNEGMEWGDTAQFCDYVLTFWKIVNVRSPTTGHRKKDENRMPVSSVDDEKLDFLTSFADWLEQWKEEAPPNCGLSYPTFLANIHTCRTLVEVARYCIEVLKFAYVLLGKFQSDSLEGRFGWYRQLSGGNYYISLRQVLVLKQFPQEVEAFQCRIVCLIQLSKFEDALTLLRKSLPALSSKCTFEKAYCEYRLGRLTEAIKTLESQGETLDFRSQELLAQLLYREEKFAECQRIYKRLLKESQDDYDKERQANLLAVEAQLKEANPAEIEVSQVAETYEQLYNESCGLIGGEAYKKAMKNLTKAENLCREALIEEGAPEDEIEEEVGLLLAQKAYCHQMMGDNETAGNIYAEILKQKPSDQVLMAVVSNNVVSIRKGEQINLFDTRKKLKTSQATGMEHKLTRKQKRTICLNNALLQLHSNQFEPCRKALTELRSKFGESEDGVLVEVCLLTRQKETEKALELLNSYLEEHPGASDTVRFALAQVYLSEGKTSYAVEVLNDLSEVKWSPGVLSLLVCINLGLEDSEKALETLAEAVEFYKKNKPKSDNLSVLVEQCATLHARMGDQKTASKYLEDLRMMKPTDPQVLARLIQAYSEFDPKKAESVCQSLSPMERVSGAEGVDVDTLEASGWILLGEKYRQKKEAKHTPKAGETSGNEGEASLIKRRKKKKRKTKLPKNMDADVQPDPERWLPKFERSTYKKKKDKRTKDRDISRGTQGAVAGTQATELDSAKQQKTPGVSSPKPAGPAAPPTAGPRQQRPGGAQNKPKKKKKGKGGW